MRGVSLSIMLAFHKADSMVYFFTDMGNPIQFYNKASIYLVA